MPKISKSDYVHARENYVGYCTACKGFTTESVEPDAEDYDCERCGEPEVIGAETALMLGLFEIK